MLLDIKNIIVHYGGVRALKGVSIALEEGKIDTFIGANGSGKSTILRAISGLAIPTSGEIWFRGERIDGKTPQSIVKRGIAQIPEGRRLFPFLSVFDNLRAGAYLRRHKSEIARNLEHVYTRFPVLKERKRQRAGTLSGGEQQMLAIGRALMANPTVLLMDEPSLGLAPMLIEEIASIVKDINQKDKVSIILVEQNAQMALSLADTGYVLETGSIVIEGKASDLLTNTQVREAYLGGSA